MKLLYPLAKRFIAGHDFESAKPVISKLMGDGFKISVDYLGELSKTKNDCEKAYRQYIEIISYYSSRGHKIDLSIKPSQLGLKIDTKYCHRMMENLILQADHNDMTVRLDMEDSSLTQSTIDLCHQVRKTYKNVGIAIQTNLFRTKTDIQNLLSSKISLRIVKGAYKETIKTAYQDKEQIKKLFIKNIYLIMTDRCRSYYHLKDYTTPVSAIGTHDEFVLREVIKNMNRFNVGKDDIDFEFLYGIRRDLSTELKDKQYTVRLYVPFGTEWLPYTLRRLKEYDNMKFVLTNVIRELWNGKQTNRLG
jgi:proline dehydrogenase